MTARFVSLDTASASALAILNDLRRLSRLSEFSRREGIAPPDNLSERTRRTRSRTKVEQEGQKEQENVKSYTLKMIPYRAERLYIGSGAEHAMVK